MSVLQLDSHPGRNNGSDVFPESNSFRKAITKPSVPIWLFAWSRDFMMSLMFCIRSPTLSSCMLETVSRAIFYCVAITSELKYSFFGEDGSIQQVNGTDKVLKF